MKKYEIEFKKAIFTPNQIIIKKRKQNIIIPLVNVDKLLYAKPTFKNYFSMYGDYRTMSVLYIYLKEKINKKKSYCLFIKYNDLIKIPEKIFNKINFYGSGDPW